MHISILSIYNRSVQGNSITASKENFEYINKATAYVCELPSFTSAPNSTSSSDTHTHTYFRNSACDVMCASSQRMIYWIFYF